MATLPDNIIVNEPLVNLNLLGVEDNEITAFETETFLPRLLVKHGFAKSTSEVKRMKPKKDQLPFWRNLNSPEFTYVEIGHKRFWLIVGAEVNNENVESI